MAENTFLKITVDEFLDTYYEIQETDNDRRFCFVLGAGASRSSGIKTGGELAKEWLEDIRNRYKEDKKQFDKWVKDKNIDIKFPGNSYPSIYDKRFEIDPVSGFNFIENLMVDVNPGFGYSVLAQILAGDRNNVVITTNFDDLVQEALYTYTNKRPLVAGHESLAQFAKTNTRRPLIVKIHRDRYFSPINKKEDTDELKKEWINPLRAIFSSFTPVFIGYGGNDGSLMDFLDQIEHFDNLFWFELNGIEPNTRVCNLLTSKNGKLVYFEGFDDLMFIMRKRLGLHLLEETMDKVYKEKLQNYKGQVDSIAKRKQITGTQEEQQISQKLFEEVSSNYWWHYELKANAAKTIEDRRKIYLEGLKNLPNSVQLLSNYAGFLRTIGENKKAEEYMIKVLQLAPDDPSYNANYATLLYEKGDFKNCKKYLLKSVNLNPLDATALANYGEYLMEIEKDYNSAKSYFEKSIEINPLDKDSRREYQKLLKLMQENSPAKKQAPRKKSPPKK